MSRPERDLTPLGHAHQRIAALEAAMLTLYDRQDRLEKALEFEMRQRRAFEEVVVAMTRLQRRIDQFEADAARRTAP
jgi:hypothetical protein